MLGHPNHLRTIPNLDFGLVLYQFVALCLNYHTLSHLILFNDKTQSLIATTAIIKRLTLADMYYVHGKSGQYSIYKVTRMFTNNRTILYNTALQSSDAFSCYYNRLSVARKVDKKQSDFNLTTNVIQYIKTDTEIKVSKQTMCNFQYKQPYTVVYG